MRYMYPLKNYCSQLEKESSSQFQRLIINYFTIAMGRIGGSRPKLSPWGHKVYKVNIYTQELPLRTRELICFLASLID